MTDRHVARKLRGNKWLGILHSHMVRLVTPISHFINDPIDEKIDYERMKDYEKSNVYNSPCNCVYKDNYARIALLELW